MSLYNIIFDHPVVRVTQEGGYINCYRVIPTSPTSAELALIMRRDVSQQDAVMAFAREQIELAQPIETHPNLGEFIPYSREELEQIASAVPIDTSFPQAPSPLETAAPRKVSLSTPQRRKLRQLAAMIGGEKNVTVELYTEHAPTHNVMCLRARITEQDRYGNRHSHTKLIIWHKVPDVHDDAFFGAQEAFNAKASLAQAHFVVCKHDVQLDREEAERQSKVTLKAGDRAELIPSARPKYPVLGKNAADAGQIMDIYPSTQQANVSFWVDMPEMVSASFNGVGMVQLVIPLAELQEPSF